MKSCHGRFVTPTSAGFDEASPATITPETAWPMPWRSISPTVHGPDSVRPFNELRLIAGDAEQITEGQKPADVGGRVVRDAAR